MDKTFSRLALPDAEPVVFERNFIKTAVCEWRFPTLLEFEQNPPVQLQKRLRRDYPHYEPGQAVRMTPESVARETRYLFRSRKKDWTVSFKASALALETTNYSNFEDFEARLERLFEQSKSFLDTDFFTRVGLRYMNELPIEDGSLSGWIRDELVAPLVQGVYGTTDKFVQEIRGVTDVGHYTFRHGILDNEASLYNLDLDFYEENVQDDEMLSLVRQFNQLSFRFFSWVIGPKARSHLGKTTAKNKGE